MEGSTQDLSPLDFDKLKITVSKAVIKLQKINELFITSKVSVTACFLRVAFVLKDWLWLN